jgi:galactoside O-acetyltransferase
MAFLTEKELMLLSFKKLGKNVQISEKASIYNCDQIEVGDNSRIDDFCVLSGNISIGRNVHLAVFCNVAGGEKGVTLSDFSGLAYGCHVFSQSDDYSGRSLTNPTVPDAYKKETKAPVFIGRHVIVGACTIVLPGVIIAEGTSVGAMSMVTKSTLEWSVYFGIPAKKIKNRSRALLDLEKLYLESELP